MAGETARLTSWLKAQPDGAIQDTEALAPLLAAAWDSFDGSDKHTTKADKLRSDRIEAPIWNNPILIFQIARHGATALGSTKAEVHEWEVDIEKGKAKVHKAGVRVVNPTQKRYNAAPVAAEIADLIINQTDDPKLKWGPDRSTVTLVMGQIIPDQGPAETIRNRRKRLRELLASIIKKSGWEMTKPNSYKALSADTPD